MAKQTNNIAANLGFEAGLGAAADKLRGNMAPSDYKHGGLRLIFLKYIACLWAKLDAEIVESRRAPGFWERGT